MKTELLDSKDDLRWLRETHLAPYADRIPAFNAAVIDGNEDCPNKITLYAQPEPLTTDKPVAVLTLIDGGEYELASN